MKSHTNRQCPKRPPIHRPCLDSLQIPNSPPCIPINLSKPGLNLPKPCLHRPCAMKYPECHCNQDFCSIETCNSSTSFKGSSSFYHSFRKDKKHDDCPGSCKKQDGGCKNAEEYELDDPISRSSSANSEKRNVGESTSTNEETANRSCPLYYSTSVADQSINTTPDYRIAQTPVNEFPNSSKKGNVNICQNRQPLTNGGFSKEVITKQCNLIESLPNVNKSSSNFNIGNNSTDQNTRRNNNSLEGETSYGTNRVNNLCRLPKYADAPQDPRFSDVNKTPRYLDNSKQYSEEPDNGPYQTNTGCPPDCYKQKRQSSFSQEPSEELQYFTKRRECNDQQTNLIQSSRTHFKHQNMASVDAENSHSDSDYNEFKKNLGSKGIQQSKNSTLKGTSTLFHPATDSALLRDEHEYTLNLNPPRYICDKCHETFGRTSDEEMINSSSKSCIADDREYQEHIRTGLASTSGSLRGRSKILNTADSPRIINAIDLNPCCLKDTSQETGSRVLTSSRRSAFMSPSLKNMLPPNSNVQGMSNETSRNQGTCCETIDSGPMNKVNIPQLHSNIKVSSNQLIGSKKQSSKDNSNHYLQSLKVKSGTNNFDSNKGTRQVADCCSHGISKLITNEHHQIKNNPNIDCVCSDAIKGIQCKKKVPCAHEVGFTSCASTSSVVNQTSGCRCRYPPAFKQFSCTGNINGSCNCSDDH